jgi:hypothetical protein
MWSFDEPVLNYQRDLDRILSADLKVEMDDELFTRNGIHTDFSRLKTVSGYFMNPMSYVPSDNSLYRKELGLDVEMTERHRKIHEELWDIVFSHAVPSSVNVAKISQGGMRRFSADPQWKLDYTAWLV